MDNSRFLAKQYFCNRQANTVTKFGFIKEIYKKLLYDVLEINMK